MFTKQITYLQKILQFAKNIIVLKNFIVLSSQKPLLLLQNFTVCRKFYSTQKIKRFSRIFSQKTVYDIKQNFRQSYFFL